VLLLHLSLAPHMKRLICRDMLSLHLDVGLTPPSIKVFLPGVEERCNDFLSSSSTTFNEKYLEVDVAGDKEKLSLFNVAIDGVNNELILEHIADELRKLNWTLCKRN